MTYFGHLGSNRSFVDLVSNPLARMLPSVIGGPADAAAAAVRIAASRASNNVRRPAQAMAAFAFRTPGISRTHRRRLILRRYGGDHAAGPPLGDSQKKSWSVCAAVKSPAVG